MKRKLDPQTIPVSTNCTGMAAEGGEAEEAARVEGAGGGMVTPEL
jgi:uncharacterized spore protein YtfJ